MTKTVAMFGSARPLSSSRIYKQSEEAAELLAKAGWIIATGGGPGLMEACNRGAVRNCKDSICSLGYSIYLPFEAETNSSVQEDTHHKTFFTRLEQFAEADAFIALPGGWGTLLEIVTVIQLLQVGHMEPRPLITVGQDWFLNLERMDLNLKKSGYVGYDEKNFWHPVKTPLEAANYLLSLPCSASL